MTCRIRCLWPGARHVANSLNQSQPILFYEGKCAVFPLLRPVSSWICPLLIVWLGTCHFPLLIFNFLLGRGSYLKPALSSSVSVFTARFCQISVKSDFLERRALIKGLRAEADRPSAACLDPTEALWLRGVRWPDSWQHAILRVAPASDPGPDRASQGHSRGADPSWVALSRWVSKPPCEGCPHSWWSFCTWRSPSAMLSCYDFSHPSILCLPLFLSLLLLPNKPFSHLTVSMSVPGEPHLRQGPRVKTQEAANNHQDWVGCWESDQTKGVQLAWRGVALHWGPAKVCMRGAGSGWGRKASRGFSRVGSSNLLTNIQVLCKPQSSTQLQPTFGLRGNALFCTLESQGTFPKFWGGWRCLQSSLDWQSWYIFQKQSWSVYSPLHQKLPKGQDPGWTSSQSSKPFRGCSTVWYDLLRPGNQHLGSELEHRRGMRGCTTPHLSPPLDTHLLSI